MYNIYIYICIYIYKIIKISIFLDTTLNQSSKFRTKEWI